MLEDVEAADHCEENEEHGRYDRTLGYTSIDGVQIREETMISDGNELNKEVIQTNIGSLARRPL